MSLNDWSRRIARGDKLLMDILDDVPGPMCSYIDRAIGKTKLRSASAYDGYPEVLYDIANALREERDDAVSMLEECRSALAALRGAVETLAPLCASEEEEA